jgi:hypothetical protein
VARLTADALYQALALLVPALSGLAGVALGSSLTSRNLRDERRQGFILEQLTGFYAPALGIRERIRTKSEVRLKVSAAANKVWPRLMEEARASGIDRLQQVREEQSPKFAKIIDYENRQLKEELIPLYRQMVDLFTTKMHLTEPSTRRHFTALVEFVEMWDRSLSGTLPSEVAELVGAQEDNLMPLYDDLEANFQRLQTALRERAGVAA